MQATHPYIIFQFADSSIQSYMNSSQNWFKWFFSGKPIEYWICIYIYILVLLLCFSMVYLSFCGSCWSAPGPMPVAPTQPWPWQRSGMNSQGGPEMFCHRGEGEGVKWTWWNVFFLVNTAGVLISIKQRKPFCIRKKIS